MFRYFILLSSLFSILFAPMQAYAQEVLENQPVEQGPSITIVADQFVRVDKKIIFDVTVDSAIPDTAQYQWDFGDGISSYGQDVVHQYDTTGEYEVTLTITYAGIEEQRVTSVFVFDRQAVFIADEEKIELLHQITEQAQDEGVAMTFIPINSETETVLLEDQLLQRLTERASALQEADVIVLDTDSSRNLQTFAQYFRDSDPVIQQLLRQKPFAVITDQSIAVHSQIAFQVLRVIGNESILVTRQEALNPLFAADTFSEVTETLDARAIEYHLVTPDDQRSYLFFLSRLVDALVVRGVPSSSIYLILVIPVLAFITVFFRQVVGISTFGVYTPVIIAAAFYFLGIGLGLLTFAFAVATSYIVKYFSSKIELLYLPKVALNISFISLSFLVVLYLAVRFDASVSLGFLAFPMLVMSSLSEKFIAVRAEQGLRNALVGIAETLMVVIVSYYLIVWPSFSSFLIALPEVLLVFLLITLLLGKYTGLRLDEYFRFRSLLLSHTEESE